MTSRGFFPIPAGAGAPPKRSRGEKRREGGDLNATQQKRKGRKQNEQKQRYPTYFIARKCMGRRRHPKRGAEEFGFVWAQPRRGHGRGNQRVSALGSVASRMFRRSRHVAKAQPSSQGKSPPIFITKRSIST